MPDKETATRYNALVLIEVTDCEWRERLSGKIYYMKLSIGHYSTEVWQ
jgi:hypothetical protein